MVASRSPDMRALATRLHWITVSGYESDPVDGHESLAEFARFLDTGLILDHISTVWSLEKLKDDDNRFRYLCGILHKERRALWPKAPVALPAPTPPPNGQALVGLPVHPPAIAWGHGGTRFRPPFDPPPPALPTPKGPPPWPYVK